MAVSFILEEGFSMVEIEKIAGSMGHEAARSGIRIVAADTKVVPKGHGDKIFITTTGIGRVLEGLENLPGGDLIIPGDHIIVTGPIGDHGAAIFASRAPGILNTEIQSDCAQIFPLIQEIGEVTTAVHFMRDPTRGGLATVLCEITENRDWGIMLDESLIPVRPGVKAICDLAGLDALYLACEGRMVIICKPESSAVIIAILKKSPLGTDASLIGTVGAENPGRVVMKTAIGGLRVITMLAGDPLPRIC
jgi:hydrogenase expression/formation protein HypE